MRVEQEQKVTEDARRYAEQDAAAQRYASQVLQVCKFFFLILNGLLYFHVLKSSEILMVSTPLILKIAM